MFQSLSDRLSHTLKSITGQAKLTEDNIKDTLREVRKALLEADVALDRGGVGRGGDQAYCVLVGEPKNEDGWKRLQVMEETAHEILGP